MAPGGAHLSSLVGRYGAENIAPRRSTDAAVDNRFKHRPVGLDDPGCYMPRVQGTGAVSSILSLDVSRYGNTKGDARIGLTLRSPRIILASSSSK